jgi:hypothetical protein
LVVAVVVVTLMVIFQVLMVVLVVEVLMVNLAAMEHLAKETMVAAVGLENLFILAVVAEEQVL